MSTEIWVNIGPGNGLLPDGTKPLVPEPMLNIGSGNGLVPSGNKPVDWSSVKSSDIHIGTISQSSITKICLKITKLKFYQISQGPVS